MNSTIKHRTLGATVLLAVLLGSAACGNETVSETDPGNQPARNDNVHGVAWVTLMKHDLSGAESPRRPGGDQPSTLAVVHPVEQREIGDGHDGASPGRRGCK